MPIFDFLCTDCGAVSEILLSPSDDVDRIECKACSSRNLKKLMAAHSSMSGTCSNAPIQMPGKGDTACCGSSPGHGSCTGPGSCCAKNSG